MKGKMKFLSDKLGYSVSAIGLDLSYGMFYSYLSKYMTDVLKIESMVFLLVLSAVARIWDGINDPMMGTIVDNTNTKLGKYRPWILRGTGLNALVLFLLFTNLFNLQGTALYVYIAVMYVAWGMTNTMADIPFWSMIPSFTNDPQERNLVSTMTRVFSGLGQGIVTIFAPMVMLALSRTYDVDGVTKVYDKRGFMIWTLICSVLLVMFGIICVLRTKETNVIKAKEKFSFGKALKIVRTNDQLLVFMLFAMLSNAGWYLTSGIATYFFENVVGDASKQSAFGLFGGIGSAVGIVVLPILTKFTSKRRTYQISLVTCILGYVAMFACAKADMLMLMNIFYVITSIGMATMFVAQTIFLADIVDYGEIKMGFRAESITFSMKGFLQKMAYTIQTVILYVGLGMSGYSGELKSANPASAKNAITVMMLIVPPVLFVLSYIVFTARFKLHGEFMDNVTKGIEQRRSGEQLQ